MKLAEHKGKYIGYDDDGRVVIISSDKKIVIQYMKERENYDSK
jgi:hypothetical protein